MGRDAREEIRAGAGKLGNLIGPLEGPGRLAVEEIVDGADGDEGEVRPRSRGEDELGRHRKDRGEGPAAGMAQAERHRSAGVTPLSVILMS